jgi:hypothetical protein
MVGSNIFETLFAVTAILFQVILITHFALRKWNFDLAMRYGWIVYALSIPFAAISMVILMEGRSWSFWLGGFIYLVWAVFGYSVEYIRGIQWRSPVQWSVMGPYVTLYLAAVMFYWWPLALINKPLWYVYAVLFVVSTVLNVTSHQKKEQLILQEATK